MGQLHQKMQADLELRGFATTTQTEYLRRARHFAAHYMRSPVEMGEQEIRDYLLYLVNEKRVRPATHRMYVAALKFLYTVTLGRPDSVVNIPWPKVPRPLPDILSGEEIERLLAAVRGIKHRAILMTAYGAGLRISEACTLEIGDVDSQRMLIHIRYAKGAKDRYVMLSERLLVSLRHYCRRARPRGPYLFPGGKPDRAITPGAVQRVLRKAVVDCALAKRVTPH
ncbi:MAG: tyrosine-type recombinase/integrase, partial [Dehalococcoidia bacterium]